MPFDRASAASALTGTSEPVWFMMWLTMISRVRRVIWSLKALRITPGSSAGAGHFASFSTTPRRLALSRHGSSPPGCSWKVIRISSPASKSRPLRTKARPSVVFLVSATSSAFAPMKAAAFARTSSAASLWSVFGWPGSNARSR